MSDVVAVTLGLSVAFLIGSVPFSYVIVRHRTGKDIRAMGSGNAGATNVFRSVGKVEGSITLAADFAKGFVAVALVCNVLRYLVPVSTNLRFALGIAAVCGHIFTPFLGFKGGKGVATGAGMALAIFPGNFVVAFLVWLTLLLTTQFMSVASIAAALVFSVTVFFSIGNTRLAWAVFATALLIVWTHRSNINRLLRGEERKTTLFKSRKTS